jgi:hypothetical protein
VVNRVMATRAGLLLSSWLALALVACKPDLDETVSLITEPRVLGVQATPAEGAPSANVTFTALVVDDTGPIASPTIAWDFCNARNPLANLGPVSPECLQQGDPNLVPIGSGAQASGAIPAIACRQFGPEVPTVMGNETPGRPVDPDSTGGYYQPVSLFVTTSSGSTAAEYTSRISCGLAEGSSDQVTEYLGQYHLNVNPVVASLTVLGGSGAWSTDTTGTANTVAVGATLQLEVAWPTCPLSDTCGDGVCGPDESIMTCPADCTKPQGCPGAERYLNYDLASQSLEDSREGIGVSWFATGGSFGLDRTGIDGSDTTTTSDNGWTAPSQAGPVHLWVVLRDDRGGVGWAGYALVAQ